MKPLTLFVLMLASVASAQRASLFEDRIESGGFGGPMMQVGSIGGSSAVFVGGKGGWIVNHTFVLGGGAYGLANNIAAKTVGPNGETQMMFGYGGLLLEYLHESDALIHWSASLLVGGGGIDYKNHGGVSPINSTSFFVAEPSVGINLNISEHFTVGAGASYRALSNFSTSIADSKDLEGGSVYLVAKFGKF
jgi:hypothetical protein